MRVVLAKSFGASVTGVCSTRNAELVRSIGADHVIDYTRQDPAQTEERYDLVVDVVGTLRPEGYKRILAPGGRGVLVGFSSVLHMMKTVRAGKKAARESGIRIQSMGMEKANKNDLLTLKEMMEAGRFTPGDRPCLSA